MLVPSNNLHTDLPSKKKIQEKKKKKPVITTNGKGPLAS